MNGRTKAGMLMALLVAGLLGGLGGVSIAAEDSHQGLSIEWACLATYPEADCTKIHLYVKNTGRFPQSLDGIYLGDRYLSLDINQEERLQPTRQDGSNQSHDPKSNRRPSRSSGSVQWHRALPNPVEPGCITDVTISLWGTVKEAAIRIPVPGGGELQWDAKEEKRGLRLSHIAFDPADPNKIYVYCENRTDEDIAIDHILVNTEKVEITSSIPTGNAIEAGRKSCFIVHPEQKMIWGRYAGVSVVGEGGEKVVAVVRVINLFPIGSSDGDTRAEMFFDSVSLYKPMPNLKRGAPDSETALPASVSSANERACQAYYNGRDPTCDNDGWQVNAVRVTSAMHDLWRYDPRTPFYTHVCQPTDRAYAYFGELPDLTLVNPYTILFRPHGPAESGRRIRSARTWIDPRPVVSVSEAFVSGKNKRDLTPDEVSFALWSEIAEGSKGARYYIRKGAGSERGYTQIPGVEAQIARDNLNLQLLKHFLRIGDTFEGIASTNDEQVACKSILCGDKGVVLILLNKNSARDKNGPTQWMPLKSSQVNLSIPRGMRIMRCLQVSHGFVDLPHKEEGGVVTINSGEIAVAKAGLILFQNGMTDYSQERSLFSLEHDDREEKSMSQVSLSQAITDYEERLGNSLSDVRNPQKLPASQRVVTVGQAAHLAREKCLAIIEAIEEQSLLETEAQRSLAQLSAIANAYKELGEFRRIVSHCQRMERAFSSVEKSQAWEYVAITSANAGRCYVAAECWEHALKFVGVGPRRTHILEELVDVYDKKLSDYSSAAQYNTPQKLDQGLRWKRPPARLFVGRRTLDEAKTIQRGVQGARGARSAQGAQDDRGAGRRARRTPEPDIAVEEAVARRAA